MKRIFTLLLCLLLGLSFATLSSARLSYINDATTNIGPSGGQAISVGVCNGYQGITTKVEITLTLQRKLASSSTWTDYYTAPKQTFNNYHGAAQLIRNMEKGYQYRTKAVYVAYSGTKSETLTGYSGAISY